MKRRLPLVLLLLAVLVAVGMFLLSGRDSAGRSEPTDTATTEQTRTSHRVSAPETPALWDDDRVGTLRLEGQVITRDEQPVAGAAVTIDSNPPRTAVSEQDGSFHFDKLLGRNYRLVARQGTRAGGPVIAKLNEASDPVVIRVGDAATVEVTVENEKGKVAGATVELRGASNETLVTNSDGVVRFEGVPAGGVRLAAHAPGYAKTHAWLRVPGGSVVSKETLRLRRGTRASGTVIDEDGASVVGARVVYSGVADWSQQADPLYDAAVTDQHGKFHIAAMPLGSFRFVARHEDHAPGQSDLVTLDDSGERTGIRIVVGRGATVSGKVVTKAGEPAGSAAVRVVVNSLRMRFRRPRQTFAGEDGSFTIKGLPRKSADIVAVHEGGSSETITLDLENGNDVTGLILKLDVDGVIAGVVVDGQGEPVVDAQVVAFQGWGGPGRGRGPGRGGQRGQGDRGRSRFRERQLRGRATARTDAGGKFSIIGLDSGEYSVRASPASTSDMSRLRFREGVTAEVGDTDVHIVLESDGGIKGKVAFADGTVPDAFVVAVGFRSVTPFATKDGSFALGDLPPRDDYSFTIRGPGFEPKKTEVVNVEPDHETDLGTIIVHTGRKIVGRVVDAGGAPAPGAKVLAGARLIGNGANAQAGIGRRRTGAIKEVIADENGDFAIYGVNPGDVSLLAEHETLGRSQAVRVNGVVQPVTEVTLRLLPLGALAGTVRKKGTLAPDMIVNAESQSVPGVMFAVTSGPDGKFRFDRLAADTYVVSAARGRNPMRGMGFHTALVTVVSGKTVQVDIELQGGDVTLLVTPIPADGVKPTFSVVQVVAGPITAKTARELEYEINALGAVFSAIAMSMAGPSARVNELAPGSYTICVAPYPAEVRSMRGIFEYRLRQGDNLPIFCQMTDVTASPTEQTIEVPVTIPTYVPPPTQP